MLPSVHVAMADRATQRCLSCTHVHGQLLPALPWMSQPQCSAEALVLHNLHNQSARARAFCTAHTCVPCAAGKAIKGIPRDKVVIASKWGPRFTVSYCHGSQSCRGSYSYWGFLSFTVLLASRGVV